MKFYATIEWYRAELELPYCFMYCMLVNLEKINLNLPDDTMSYFVRPYNSIYMLHKQRLYIHVYL